MTYLNKKKVSTETVALKMVKKVMCFNSLISTKGFAVQMIYYSDYYNEISSLYIDNIH